MDYAPPMNMPKLGQYFNLSDDFYYQVDLYFLGLCHEWEFSYVNKPAKKYKRLNYFPLVVEDILVKQVEAGDCPHFLQCYLRKQREELSKSMKDLAVALGVYVPDVERGLRSLPQGE